MHLKKIERPEHARLNSAQIGVLKRFFYPGRIRGNESEETRLYVTIADINRLARAALVRTRRKRVNHGELARLIENDLIDASSALLSGCRTLLIPTTTGRGVASLGDEIDEKARIVAESLGLGKGNAVPIGALGEYCARLSAACSLPARAIRPPRCAEILAAELDGILEPAAGAEWFSDTSSDGRPLFRRDAALWLSATANGQPTSITFRPLLDLTEIS